MARCSKIRSFLMEIATSPFIEKLSFILPFVVIAVDIIILEHAIRINETYIILFTTFLFILSFIEIILVAHELHKNYKEDNFKKVLKCKIDSFIGSQNQYHLKKIVEDFITINPEYCNNRIDVYKITSRVLKKRQEAIYEDDIDKYHKK